MAHHVYANNNEIASKSSSGSSAGAAPDVCMSPPGPKAGPVPIPYSNTCKHSDLDNLASTVFVGGTGMALEDKSFFSTSYGDEPATESYSKGVISGKIKGKCYFQSWSPNVKAEGLGVDRHMDIVTHNHVNQANAVSQRYQSREYNDSWTCRKDRNRIAKKCNPKSDDERSRKPAKRGRVARLMRGVVTNPDEALKDAYGYRRNSRNAWVEDYCDGLWANALPEGMAEELQEQKEQLQNLYDEFKDKGIIETVESLSGEVVEAVTNHLGPVIGEMVAETIAKAIAKAIAGAAAAGTAYGVVVTVALWAWTAYDIYALKRDVFDKMGDTGKEYLDMLMNPHKLKDKMKEQLDALTQGTPNQIYSNLQEMKANASACIRARKCKLVTYNQSKRNPASQGGPRGSGCCPGQTGHHLLPDSMFRSPDPQYSALPRGQKPTYNCWGNYNEGGALTICVEGGASAGSHGMFHTETADIVRDERVEDSHEVDYTTMRSRLADLMSRQYGCKKACIEKQLDEYYESAYTCGNLDNAKVVAHTGQSGGAPSIGTDTPADSDI